MDGKDPCALLPESTWARLFIDKPGERDENECFYSTKRASLTIALVTHEGVEVWRAGRRVGQSSDMAPIADFPTISIQLPDKSIGCGVAVDVAAGQYLLVRVIPDYKIEELPEKCEYAHQLAETAMNTLVA